MQAMNKIISRNFNSKCAYIIFVQMVEGVKCIIQLLTTARPRVHAGWQPWGAKTRQRKNSAGADNALMQSDLSEKGLLDKIALHLNSKLRGILLARLHQCCSQAVSGLRRKEGNRAARAYNPLPRASRRQLSRLREGRQTQSQEHAPASGRCFRQFQAPAARRRHQIYARL